MQGVTIESLSPFRPKRLDAKPLGYFFEDLIEFAASVDYVPAYAIGRKDLVHIRCLKDAACNYIWRAGDDFVSSSINGYPYLKLLNENGVFIFDHEAWRKSKGHMRNSEICGYCGAVSKDSIGRCTECGAGR